MSFMIGSFSPSRAFSIARKEVRHILRDPFTMAMALGLPVGMVIFFGFVFNFDVDNIRLAVVDRDQSRASRQLVQIFSASKYFEIRDVPAGRNPIELIDREAVKAVLIIEPQFGKKISRGETAPVQLTLDGADNQTAGIIASYLMNIQRTVTARFGADNKSPPVLLQTRFLYNHELNSRWFIVPGLIVVIVGILSVLLTALTVAREWENGSMELLLATPVEPLEIIVGKLAPYTVLGLGGVLMVYVAARVGFGVPFRGHHLVFFISCLMFLATAMSQGLVISVVTRQQQIAMQLAQMTGLLPSLLLSGFIFPVESMPRAFQVITSILPPRWFMVICRDIFLKGSSLVDLAKPFLALTLIHLVFLRVALKKFKKDLEP